MSYGRSSENYDDHRQNRRRSDDDFDDDRYDEDSRRPRRDQPKRKGCSPAVAPDNMSRIEELFRDQNKSSTALHKALERTLKDELGEVKKEVRSLRTEVEENSSSMQCQAPRGRP